MAYSQGLRQFSVTFMKSSEVHKYYIIRRKRFHLFGYKGIRGRCSQSSQQLEVIFPMLDPEDHILLLTPFP